MIIKKDSEIVKAKVERKSRALKAKKESSDEECSTSGSEDEEYSMAVRDFKKLFKRRDKNQRAFVEGSWSDSGEENDEKVNNETCLVAQASSEVTDMSKVDKIKGKKDKIKLGNEMSTKNQSQRPIEFGGSYKSPPEETGKGPTSKSSAKKNGRTVVITTEDMQKRRNDVKARTTLLLALPDEHRLRFSKYETTKELWEAILKTFGGNETTKKTKKNQLKQQYGNFKAEGSETLKQTFNRLQAIMSHLEFMDVKIEQDDLNQKFLTSLAPEWLIGKGEVHTASVLTTSIRVPTASTDVAAASLNHDAICVLTNQKWNVFIATKWAILLESAEHLEVKTESYMANEEENHALVADDEVPTEFALLAKSRSSSENEVYDDSYCNTPKLGRSGILSPGHVTS
nr:hypothetical protein [Tanacetum cinerariifolium]